MSAEKEYADEVRRLLVANREARHAIEGLFEYLQVTLRDDGAVRAYDDRAPAAHYMNRLAKALRGLDE